MVTTMAYSAEIDLDKLKSFSEMAADQEPKAEVVVEETEEVEPTDEPAEAIEDTEGDESEGSDKDSKTEPKKTEKVAPWGKSNKVPKGVQDRFRTMTEKIRTLESKLNSKAVEGKEEQQYDLRDPVQLAQYIAETMDAKATEREEKRRQHAEYEVLNKKWTENFEKAKEQLEDYDEVLAESKAILPNSTLRHIVESDVGPYVSYTIAKDLALQELINGLAPAERHAKVLEVEKTVRSYLNGSKPVSPAKGGVQTPAAKPALKAPGSTVKKAPGQKVKLDPATADVMDWINNT